MIRKETGYTLVELLVTLAITGIIFTAVGTAIYQLTTVSNYGNDQLTAGHELQNTACWFNRDSQAALTAAGGEALNLTLPRGQTIIYSLAGNDLQRIEGPVSKSWRKILLILISRCRGG